MAVDVGVIQDGIQARPSQLLPGQWSFWADMLVGAVPLGPVDVTAFTCTSKLSDFGSGSVTLALPSGLPPDRLQRLWSWRLWAYYAGQPYWCGIPTGVTDAGLATATMTLTELPGYLTRRVPDWNPSKVYTQVEQTSIAADLAAPLGDVGVSVVTDPGSGVKRDRTYEYLQSGTMATLLTNLSGVLQGPEFRAEYATGPNGRPGCTLRIVYPRVGSGAAGLGVNVPGPLAYSAQWDSDQLRTRTFAIGDTPATAAAGTARPVSITDQPQTDRPRLDMIDDWSGTVLTTTLKERSATSASQYATPTLKLTVTPSEALPDLGTYRVGDDVTVRAVTPLMPAGIVITGRLLEVDVDAGAGTAAWTMSTTLPPPKARETIAGKLSRLDQTIDNVFHAGPKTVLP